MPNSIYDTVTNYGTVTNPAGGAVIATLTVTAAGYYKVDCVVATSGTTTAVDTDNMRLNIPGNDPIVLMGTQGTGALSATSQQSFAYIPAGAVITITVANASAGGSIYRAKLALTPWPREENTVGRLS